MIGGALAYPFLLWRARPLTVTGWLLVGLALALLTDFGWYRLTSGVGLAPNVSALAQSFYYSVRALLQAFPVAAILTAALRHLGVRAPGRRFRIADGLRVAGVTTLYVVCFVAPLEFAQSMAMRALVLWRQSPAPFWLVSLAVLALQWLVLSRFVFLWAHVVGAEKFELRPALRLVRGRYWRIAGVLAPLIVLVTLVAWGGQVVGWLIYTAVDASSYRMATAAFSFGWIVNITVNESARIVGAYLFNAAGAYLYARFAPERPQAVADVF